MSERHGVKTDWEDVYVTHAVRMTAFASSLVGPSDAADLVADVFVKLLRSDPTISSNIEGYLFRAVLNAARSNARSLTARRNRELSTARPESHDEQTSQWDPELESLIQKLSPQQRAVLYLRYVEDQPVSSIAAVLGCSQGSVKKQLARSHKKLRLELQHV